jgi:folate-binding protein YgfZ
MKHSLLSAISSPQAESGTFMGMKLPRFFTSVEEEVQAAACSVAMVDRSFCGRIRVTGADGIDLLHRISTNDLKRVTPGHAVPTIFTNEKGRLIDYVWILFLEHELIIVCSPGCETPLISWIDKYTLAEDVHLEDLSSSTAMMTLLGPQARVTAANTKLLESGSTVRPFDGGVAYFSNDFHTSSVSVIGPADRISSIWNRFRTIAKPMGFESFDTFRISRGMPLPNHEISDRFNPYDVGLTHAISYSKGCYIGQEVIARLDTYQKAMRVFVGITFQDRPQNIGNHTALLYGSEDAGVLTSLSRHTVGGSYVGAAVVKKEIVNQGSELLMGPDPEMRGQVREFPILFDHY